MQRILGRPLLWIAGGAALVLLRCASTTVQETAETTPSWPKPDSGHVPDIIAASVAVPQYSLDSYLARPCEDEMSPDTMIHYTATLVSARQLHNKIVHDCQKLLLDRGHYGPLAAIQVADSLDYRLSHVADGVVIADIVVYDTLNGYDPLQLQRKLNCLWVQGDSAHPEGWHVEILHEDSSCVNAHPTDGGTPVGQRLTV